MAVSNQEVLENIKQEFRDWISSTTGLQHINNIDEEIIEVQELLSKLEKMDQSSEEFSHTVLYGLLPYHNTKYALRTSQFPVFMNIKHWFRNYNYTEEDYQKIAQIIFKLAIQVRDHPEQTQKWINEFDNNPLRKGLQCGSITPILFCLNDDLPLINGQVKKTNAYFTKFYNHGKISTQLKNYEKSRNRLVEFRNKLDMPEIDTWAKMDLFCYWFNTLRKRKRKAYTAPRNYTALLEELDPEKTELFNNLYQPKPNRVTISEIIDYSEKNKWVLPYFQRYFSWTRTNVKDFLTSIFNDYYVGSFLFWEMYGEEMPMGILPIQGVKTKIDERQIEYVIIDGQQRITSLYYAIKAPKYALRGSKYPAHFYLNLEKYFRIIADLEDESDRWDIAEVIEVRRKKYTRKESFEKMLFPIYELENRSEWIKEFQKHLLETTQNKEKVYEIIFFLIQKLENIYNKYSIPYIALPTKVKIYEVTNIFENINSKGKPLSTFDLLIARILRHNINLREIWDKTITTYPKIKEYYKYRDIIPIYILQTIALTHTKSGSCKKKDLLNIAERANLTDEENFKQIWNATCTTFEDTINQIENLRDGYGAKNKREIPFMSMLPILTALNYEIQQNQKNKAICNKKMDQFYWSAVFSNAYSASVESQLTLDYREMKKWFTKETLPSTIINAREEIERINFRKISQKSSARYRGILSLIGLNGARDFETGKTLELARSNDKHHIFPHNIYKEHEQVDSVLNITWLSSQTNRKIGKTQPSDYYKDFTEKYESTDNFNKLLTTHLFTYGQLKALQNNEFEKFLDARNEAMIEVIKKKIGSPIQDSPNQILDPSEPYSNVVKLRNTVNSCKDRIYWVDKYFSTPAFEIILESIDPSVKELKILTSIDKTSEKIRSDFKRFRNELKNREIEAEMRIIMDSKIKKPIHDRWIIAPNVAYNVPSVDSIMRGQYTEIKETKNKVPFMEWWVDSLDIIHDWNKIKEKLPTP